MLRVQPVSHLSVSPVSSRNKKKEKKRKRKSAFCHHTDAQGWIVWPHVGVRACSHVSLHGRALVTSLVKHVENIWPVPAVCVRGKGKEEERLDSGGPLWRCPPTSAALPSLMHLLNAPEVVVTGRRQRPPRTHSRSSVKATRPPGNAVFSWSVASLKPLTFNKEST